MVAELPSEDAQGDRNATHPDIAWYWRAIALVSVLLLTAVACTTASFYAALRRVDEEQTANGRLAGQLKLLESELRAQREKLNRTVETERRAHQAHINRTVEYERRRARHQQMRKTGEAALSVKAMKTSAVAVTSIHLPHLNLMMTAQSSNFLLSHPLPLQLYAYYDGNGRYDGKASPPRLDAVTWIDLAEAQPWATRFAEEHMRHNSSVQRAYRNNHLKCVVGGIMRVTGLCKDVLTVLKVAAIFDACVVRRVKRWIIWVDSDAYFFRAPDAMFWKFVTRFDAVTIFRRGGRSGVDPEAHPKTPETGIMGFDAESPAVEKLLHDAIDAYCTPAVYAKATSVNDVSIFDLLFRTSDPARLRLGRFGVGCRPHIAPGTTPGTFAAKFNLPKWVRETEGYANHITEVDCPDIKMPQTASTISPFNVFSYIIHMKSFGPMAKGGLGGSVHNAPGVNGDAGSRAVNDWKGRIYGTQSSPPPPPPRRRRGLARTSLSAAAKPKAGKRKV